MTSWRIAYYETDRGQKPVKEFIDSLSAKEQNKIFDYLDLLKDKGFKLPQPYLKPITRVKHLWELRPGRYRIFLAPIQNTFLLLHVIIKKTQKTPQSDIKLCLKRMKEYL